MESVSGEPDAVEREDDGVLLLHRHKAAAPIGHSVRKLRDRTVLALFRRLLVETRVAFETGGETAVFRALSDALGGSVYGLASVFTKACAQPLSLPETDRDLYELLLRDLYVECPRSERAQYIRFESGALRVRTDDDEVDLAYGFVPEALVRAQPGRWAWWAFGDERLPSAVSEGDWAPSFEVQTSALNGLRAKASSGAGRTWAVLLSSYDGDSFGFPGTFVIDGARLPELGRALREALPATSQREQRWPYELRLLRAMVAPDEDGIGAALARCAEFPVQRLGGQIEPEGDHASSSDAFDAFARAVADAIALTPAARSKWSFVRAMTPEQRIAKGVESRLDVGEHHAMLCTSGGWRYFDQWVFFDDRWASANASLANGLLVFATSWDPLRVAAIEGRDRG